MSSSVQIYNPSRPDIAPPPTHLTRVFLHHICYVSACKSLFHLFLKEPTLFTPAICYMTKLFQPPPLFKFLSLPLDDFISRNVIGLDIFWARDKKQLRAEREMIRKVHLNLYDFIN